MHVLVLSPHRDDAAFSCGLLLRALLSAEAHVLLANICTVSDYAPYLTQSAMDRVQQVTRAREQEDVVFAAGISQDANAGESLVSLIDLHWQDAPLRWSVDAAEVVEPSPVRPDERDTLAHAFLQLAACDCVLAPVGVGGHVDHLLVRDAARQAFSPEQLLFYEDLPYACRAAPIDTAAATLPGNAAAWREWLGPRSAPGTKQRLASFYPSQVAADVSVEMEQYAAALGWRERFYGTADAIGTVQRFMERHGLTK